MSEPHSVKPAGQSSSAVPTDTVVRKTGSGRRAGGSFFALRRPVPQWQAMLFGLLCVFLVRAIWWLLTLGEAEDRVLSYQALPSPSETLQKEQLHELIVDSEIVDNTLASLRRVVLGFLLAALVGIPIGVLC